MRRPVLAAAGFAAAVALAACQEQRTIVVEQAQSANIAAAGIPPGTLVPRTSAGVPPRPHGPAQCNPPWGTGPFTLVGKPVSTQPVPIPPRALAAHVSGCGGVRFRIGPDGAPQDVEVMADYPIGYGFGDHVREIVEHARWAPKDDLSWHYLNYTVHVPHA